MAGIMSVQPINNLTFEGNTKLNLEKVKRVNPFEKYGKYSKNGQSTFSYINFRKECLNNFKQRNLSEYKIYEFLTNHPKIYGILKILGL